jgi:hypothetical protein
LRRFRIHPDIVWIDRPDRSSRLLHMGANVFAIDPASTELLRLILRVGPEQSAAQWMEQHGVERAQAYADVEAFVKHLQKQKIIQREGSINSPTEFIKAVTARVCIPAALHTVHLLAKDLRRKSWGLLLVAKWAVTQFGMALAVRRWTHFYSQPDVSEQHQDLEMLNVIDAAVRETTSRHFLNAQCKERGLTCLALCRHMGFPAELVIGMTFAPLEGHVWVESAGRILSDDPEHCQPYEPVARYG